MEAETVDPLASVPEILEQIEHEIMPELKAQFAGIRYIYQGQQKYSQEAMGQAGKYYLFAFADYLLCYWCCTLKVSPKPSSLS